MSDKVIFHNTIVDMFSSLSDNALLVIGARLERFLDDYRDYCLYDNQPFTSYDLDAVIPDLREFQILLKIYCCKEYSDDAG